MALFTITCPDCGAVLKSKSALPAGRKVKCPACAKVFAVPADTEADEAVSDRPLPSVPVARRRARAVEDYDDDPYEDEAPAEDYDEEEEEPEDRPRRKKKGRKKQGGGGNWLLIGGLAAGLLLVLGCGGGVGAYFLWFYGINRGSGDEDPLAYVPPNTNLIIGIDYGTLLNDPVLGPQLETAIRQQGGSANLVEEVKKQTGLEFKELFAHTVVSLRVDSFQGGNGFGGGGMPGGMAAPGIQGAQTLVLRPSRPFNQRKVAQASKNAVRKSYGGWTYYEINDNNFKTLFMPSDRTIVLSNVGISELGPLIQAGGTHPNVSPGTTALIRTVEKNTLWVAVPLEGELRQNLDAGLFQHKPPENVKPLVDAMESSSCAAVWGNLEGDKVKMGIGVSCPEAGIAAHVAEVAKDFWSKQSAQMNTLGLMRFVLPKTSEAYRELTASLHFGTRGTVAEVTGEISRPSLGDAVAELQKTSANKQAGANRAGPRFGR